MRFPFVLLFLTVLTRAAAVGLTPEELKIVASVDSHREDFIRDLQEAIMIDSATENHEGIRRMAAVFGRQLTSLGFASRFAELPATTGRVGHLIAEHRGMKGKRVLLLGHLDTVYPGGNYRRADDTAFGSGVCDMKGGDLVLIHALRALHETGLLADTQIIVVMTGDEEAPGSPVDVARRDLVEAASHSDLVLAFESAVGHTGTVARRGFVTWLLETQGATAHSSGIFSDAVGSGSVYEMARILSGFHTELRKLDGVTLNPALVAGGADGELTRTGGKVAGKANIIPQRTLVRGDLRFVSAEQLAEAQAKMQAVVNNGHLPRTSAVLTFDEGYAAMPPTPGNYALLAQLDQVSRDLGFGEITAFDPRGRGAGDISFVSPPLPGLDGLGLDGDGAHTLNESANLALAPELIKRTALLLYRLTR